MSDSVQTSISYRLQLGIQSMSKLIAGQTVSIEAQGNIDRVIISLDQDMRKAFSDALPKPQKEKKPSKAKPNKQRKKKSRGGGRMVQPR